MINTNEIAKEHRLTHWAGVMREQMASSMNIREYCKHIGICENTYYYWQRRVRSADCEQLAKLEQVTKNPTPSGFSEVVVYEPPSEPLPIKITPKLQIEIFGMQITTDSAYPADKLAALLRELAQPC